MKKISIVTPCYNEEANIEKLYQTIRGIFDDHLTNYEYEHILIDNASTDNTVEKVKKIAANDSRVKLIVNSRNFGHIRSPHHAIKQSTGDALIVMASDLQDPPELIPDFIKKWEEGYKIVVGVKTKSKENPLMGIIRKLYYKVINAISEVEQIENYMGFGLYDKQIVNIINDIDDPYPYLRGLICEIGFEKAFIEYTKPNRAKGITKNNFYTLYDMAMLGITTNSKIPLRVATMLGFLLSGISLLIALVYFVYKLIYWDQFVLGLAPLVIGLFFFSSVQLFFIGIIGEYIATINTKVTNRPLVFEKERVNF